MRHAGLGRDLLRQWALHANVDKKRRHLRMCHKKGFDLVQGRHAQGSRWTVLVEERQWGLKEVLHILVGPHPPHHLSLSPRSVTSLDEAIDCSGAAFHSV